MNFRWSDKQEQFFPHNPKFHGVLSAAVLIEQQQQQQQQQHSNNENYGEPGKTIP